MRSVWDDFVDRCENGTLFHKYDWLKAAENHSKAKLIPLAVYKDENLVCIFPLYVKRKYTLKIALSPPNGCGIPHLGPLFTFTSDNAYKREKSYFPMVDEILRYIEDEIGYDYLRVIFSPHLSDLRPFQWNGLSIEPSYICTQSLDGKGYYIRKV
jgi:hypothetical protein